MNNLDVQTKYLAYDLLPNLIFSDKYIESTNYINRKKTLITNNTTFINYWNNYYVNLKNFVDIETLLYKILYESIFFMFK